MMFALIALVFVAAAGIVVSAFYFFIEQPALGKAVRARLEAIRQISALHRVTGQTDLLRQEMLSNIPSLHRLLLKFPPAISLNLFLQQSGLQMTAARLLASCLAAGCLGLLIGFMLGFPALLNVLIMLGAGGVPFMVLFVKRRKRLSKFEEQFPDALELLARAVRAGHAFTTGLELIAKEMPEPVAGEFRKTYDQQNLGMSLRDALEALGMRMPLQDVHVFVTALIIQRESGGNMAEIIDNLSRVIRDRFKLFQQIKVFTAQGRMSLLVLMLIAPAMALAMYVVSPGYITVLFTDPLGQRALLVAAIFQILGFLVIRKIVEAKV
jgi:tight adherence protein B